MRIPPAAPGANARSPSAVATAAPAQTPATAMVSVFRAKVAQAAAEAGVRQGDPMRPLAVILAEVPAASLAAIRDEGQRIADAARVATEDAAQLVRASAEHCTRAVADHALALNQSREDQGAALSRLAKCLSAIEAQIGMARALQAAAAREARVLHAVWTVLAAVTALALVLGR